MDQFSVTTHGAGETVALGKKCMEEALKKGRQDTPLIFYLKGELGAGKTHFVKGLARALGIYAITSPTFVVMKKFALRGLKKEYARASKRYFFHIDCYRIRDSKDARQIGLDTILKNPRAIFAIEWAERMQDIIPRPYWKIEFSHKGEQARSIKIQNIKNVSR